MKILLFGGTRFFGKRLVRALVAQGNEVFVATRGNRSDDFGDSVTRIRLDRSKEKSMRDGLKGKGDFDVVFDQICFSASEATSACSLLSGRVGRYVFTSTLSVYDKAGCLKEEDYDPYTYLYDLHPTGPMEYGEGKRQAEAHFFRHAPFPVSAMRIPIVLGTDDYTGRLDFHIKHILEEKPIVIGNLAAESCYISSDEAAKFLVWLGLQSKFTGPLNACADGIMTIGELIKLIESVTNKKAIVVPTGGQADESPFVSEQSWYLDNAKAKGLGYQFTELGDWLPDLIESRVQSIRNKTSLAG